MPQGLVGGALLLLVALAPCAALLAWYLHAVRRAPEPASRVVGSVLAGVAMFGLAAVLQRWLTPALADAPDAVRAFGLVATSEELLKLGATLAVAGWPGRWERLVSGVVYAVAVAVGFAAAENIAYVSQYGASTGAIRAMTAVPGHVLHSALIGVALGRWSALGPAAAKATVAAAVAAITAHGAYDLLLTLGGPARFGVLAVLTVETVAVGWLFTRARAEDLARDVEALTRVPLLAGAPASSLRLLAERSVRRRLPSDRFVVREGGPGGRLFLLLEGRLLVERDIEDGREALAELLDGAVVGELSVLTGEPRNADVTTVEPSLLLSVPRVALLEAIEEAPELAEGLLRAARPRADDPAKLPTVDALRADARRAFDAGRMRLERDGLAHRLARVPLLSRLPGELLERLADDAVVVQQRSGSRIVKQGAGSPGLCLLLDGDAQVIRDGEVVDTLVEGDFFGEDGLLTGWSATTTVRATTPVRLCALRWQEVGPAVGRAPELGVALLDAFEERLHALRRAGLGVEPGEPTPWQRAARRLAGGGRSLDDAESALLEAFAELRTLPPSAVRALAGATEELALPGTLPATGGFWLGAEQRFFLSDEHLEETLARSPEVLRFLARCRLTSTASLVGRELSPRTKGFLEARPRLRKS